MTISDQEVILTRIASATKSSPIAVFKVAVPGKGVQLNAVFVNTYHTQQMMKTHHLDYVGSFHAGMSKKTIRSALLDATKYI